MLGTGLYLDNSLLDRFTSLEKDVKVLVIDDDKFVHKFIKKQISSNFTLIHAFNGEEGMDTAINESPDVILLDVEMPGRNGYEVCELMRNMQPTRNTPIIFLSSKILVREVMLGYEAGADDYIGKPFDNDVLSAKIQVLLTQKKEQLALKSEVQEAQKIVMSALTGNSEFGLVMQFIESSYGITQVSTLAQRFFKLSEQLALKCSISFKIDGEHDVYSSSGIVKPLESELLANLRESGRFVDFGCRTIINYPRVSVLIKNMPLDNPELYGRYKDLFPVILGSIDAKISSLEDQQRMLNHATHLGNSFDKVKTTLLSLASTLSDNSSACKESLYGLYRKFDDRIPTLGLEEDQENFFYDALQESLEDIGNNLFNKDENNDSFELILSTFQELVDKQNRLIEKTQEENLLLQGSAIEKTDGDYEPDIELF